MVDTDAKLSKVLDLLIQQTKNGKLSWKESYRNSFQSVLSKQTVVVRYNLLAPVLEIRDSRGEIVQQIGKDATDVDFGGLSGDPGVVRTDQALRKKVVELYNFLKQKYDYELDTTLDNILEELEK
jgi:hypothetical protein